MAPAGTSASSGKGAPYTQIVGEGLNSKLSVLGANE